MLDKNRAPEGWIELIPNQTHGLPRYVLVARTVVDLGKPVVAVRVLNMSDNERIVQKGTYVVNCELIELEF